jgi:hypothetical protein
VGTAWAVRAYRAMELKQWTNRSKAECRSNLRAIFVGEKAHFGEFDAYSEDFWKIGFSPERGNRGVYLLTRAGPVEDRRAATTSRAAGAVSIIGADEYRFPSPTTAELLAMVPTSAELGMRGTCPTCEVTAICVTPYQRWSISTASRAMPDGGVVPAGELSLDQSVF